MSGYLFITGMPRSGTTLLDKVLSLHPRACVLSQPLPQIYVEVKREFSGWLLRHGSEAAIDQSYPLNDMFGANAYRVEDFLRFLNGYHLTGDFVRAILESMTEYDGQYTKPDEPFAGLENLKISSLIDLVRIYTEQHVGEEGLSVLGSKETYMEEYIPYFLHVGAKVLLIVREPRDVLTSLNHGGGRKFGGLLKPHLFNIRQWRKSVAFAAAYRKEPRFMAIRYEDMVTDPAGVFERITDWLDLNPLPQQVWEGDLHDQSGNVWRSNSSHFPTSRISSTSIGVFNEHLNQATDQFVQATCLPELRHLAYPTDISAADVPAILQRHSEDAPLERPALAAYEWSPERSEEELARWEALSRAEFLPHLFIFPEAFSSLRNHMPDPNPS